MNNFSNCGANTENKNDDDLINAYIGDNVEAIRNRGFSFNTFLFGIYYVIYRKVWPMLLKWVLLDILIKLLFGKLLIIIGKLVINLYFSYQFKDFYLEYVEKQVNKIKEQNKDKPREELINICKRKGGTLIPSNIALILGIILYIILLIDVIQNEFSIIVNKVNKKDSIGELNYIVPSNLSIQQPLDEEAKFYGTHNSHDICSLKVTSTQVTQYNYDPREYLLDISSYERHDNTMSQQNINGNVWFYKTLTSDHDQTHFYYSILYDGKLYGIDFEMSKYEAYNKTCVSSFNTFKESLKFK